MQEMNNNLKDLRERNQHFEKIINDLTEEVRGYREAKTDRSESNPADN